MLIFVIKDTALTWFLRNSTDFQWEHEKFISNYQLVLTVKKFSQVFQEFYNCIRLTIQEDPKKSLINTGLTA